MIDQKDEAITSEEMWLKLLLREYDLTAFDLITVYIKILNTQLGSVKKDLKTIINSFTKKQTPITLKTSTSKVSKKPANKSIYKEHETSNFEEYRKLLIAYEGKPTEDEIRDWAIKANRTPDNFLKRFPHYTADARNANSYNLPYEWDRKKCQKEVKLRKSKKDD